MLWRVVAAMPDHIITLKLERGFVRLFVDPSPVGGFGLPSTYSSIGLAQAAADRLHREHGWSIKRDSHAN